MSANFQHLGWTGSGGAKTGTGGWFSTFQKPASSLTNVKPAPKYTPPAFPPTHPFAPQQAHPPQKKLKEVQPEPFEPVTTALPPPAAEDEDLLKPMQSLTRSPEPLTELLQTAPEMTPKPDIPLSQVFGGKTTKTGGLFDKQAQGKQKTKTPAGATAVQTSNAPKSLLSPQPKVGAPVAAIQATSLPVTSGLFGKPGGGTKPAVPTPAAQIPLYVAPAPTARDFAERAQSSKGVEDVTFEICQPKVKIPKDARVTFMVILCPQAQGGKVEVFKKSKGRAGRLKGVTSLCHQFLIDLVGRTEYDNIRYSLKQKDQRVPFRVFNVGDLSWFHKAEFTGKTKKEAEGGGTWAWITSFLFDEEEEETPEDEEEDDHKLALVLCYIVSATNPHRATILERIQKLGMDSVVAHGNLLVSQLLVAFEKLGIRCVS